MTRYMVQRANVPEEQDPVIPFEGQVKVEGGALVFRKDTFGPPVWILAAGQWTDVWSVPEEGR